MAVPPADSSDPAGPFEGHDRSRSGPSERDPADAGRSERRGRDGGAERKPARGDERGESDDGLSEDELPDDDGFGGEGFPAADSLRGRVLVAGRHLRDPNFFRTLVLLVEHGADGAFGLVVNRPTDTTVQRALAGHLDVTSGSEPVFFGGPVEPNALFVLHNSVEFADGELPVCSGLFVGNSREAFEGLVDRVDAGDSDTRYRVFSGCSGWGPGQLEQELERADWKLIDADAVLAGDADPVFGADPYAAWEAFDRLTARLPVDGLDDAGDFRMN